MITDYATVSYFARQSHSHEGVMELMKQNIDCGLLQQTNEICSEMYCEFAVFFYITLICMSQ